MFRSEHEWLRDHYLCSACGSIPRERALMATIDRYYPDWPSMAIHEASPIERGASIRLRGGCADYTATHLIPGELIGAGLDGFRNENLEDQTFDDEWFDLVVTQDVMEHVFEPARAFQEIARTLKPGGAHIFTTPLVNKEQPSEVWARRLPAGSVMHVHEPEYHSAAQGDEGSLVTMHWGYDITQFIHRSTGLPSTIVYIDDVERGIRAEYIEVIVTHR